jgi:hypothetical protein
MPTPSLSTTFAEKSMGEFKRTQTENISNELRVKGMHIENKGMIVHDCDRKARESSY